MDNNYSLCLVSSQESNSEVIIQIGEQDTETLTSKHEIEVRLIDLVRENAILFDLAHPNYKNEKKKQNCWEQICRILNSESAKNETVQKWKLAWKSLRNQYNSYKRRLKQCSGSGSGNGIKKVFFRHADIMRFLDDKDISTTTMSNVHENGDLHDQEKSQTENNEHLSVEITSENLAPNSRKRSKNTDDQLENALAKYINNVEPPRSLDEYDNFGVLVAQKLRAIFTSKSAQIASACQLDILQILHANMF